MCSWIIANRLTYNLYRTRKRNRKVSFGGNGGGVASLATWLDSSLPGMAEWPRIH